MNFFSMFEDRVASIFGTSPEGYTEPFSFKKLAKRVVKEMDNNTYDIQGTPTAPALFTILISTQDDAAMRPLYGSLTKEISQFVESQAQAKGRVFAGEPVIRFMVDPSLRNGRFSVFAENVDARTLARLRAEELSFLGGAAVVPATKKPAGAPRPERRVTTSQAQVMTAIDCDSSLVSQDQGLDVIPASDTEGPYVLTVDAPGAPQSVALADATGFDAAPAPVIQEAAQRVSAPVSTPRQEEPPVAPVVPAQAAPVHQAAPTSMPSAPAEVPPTTRRVSPLEAAPEPTGSFVPTGGPSCLLIDRQSGRTYAVTGTSTIIGRGRSTGGIVLHDPNVSRRHAELTHGSAGWRITDLNSTNGTLVNDIDIDECALRDGDLITLGLTNLEFREG